MKTCPHCDSQIPEDEILCPHCGKEYWVPEIPGRSDRDTDQEDEKPGCLQVFLIPLVTALLSAAFLVSCGVIINLITHFESNQVKIAWLLGSVLAGVAVYFLLSKKRKQDRK
ncbi:MAG: hypothetical protein JSV46_10530 [Candidatus Aminicenantes bacterium]|nr:MAG: hypothetical protein JSV46_10530 [Candidatus Aminicenantes bacterium]